MGLLDHMETLFILRFLRNLHTLFHSDWDTNSMQEGSVFSTSSPACIICRLFDDSHSDPCEVISHCGFDLHFSNNEWCWASFHVLLYIKGNYKQGEKTTIRMGENNSKGNNWQRINFQNTQAAHTSQYEINKEPNQKVGKRPKQTFLQRRYTDG